MKSFRFPSRSAWMWSILLVVACQLAFCGIAAAAEGEQAEAPGFIEVWILGGGGFPGVLIVIAIELMSFAVGALAIEHFVTLQRDKLVPPEVVVELEQFLDEEQYDEAITLCEASKNYITNIVGASIQRVAEGYDSMQSTAEAATEEENIKLVHKVSWLSLIGNLGPMMGLFGTVFGMVQAFQKIATSTTSPSPSELASGIFTALVTTVWGLLVGIPALAFFSIFKNKVQRLSFELSGVAMEIVERFKPAAPGGK